ncbi:putative zinc finger protein [Ordospora colligata]|nr:putative zinc finger protein [Ordospora colligata]
MLPKMNVPTRLGKEYLLEHRMHKAISKPAQHPHQEDSRSSINHRTVLCKFFLMNSCRHGENCTYSHETNKFPCRMYYLNNNCNKKDCSFSHGPFSDDVICNLISEKHETVQFKSTLK